MKDLDDKFPTQKVILKVPEVVLQSVGNTGCNCIRSHPHWDHSPSWGNSRGTGPAAGRDRIAGRWVCRLQSLTAMTCSREDVWFWRGGSQPGTNPGERVELYLKWNCLLFTYSPYIT